MRKICFFTILILLISISPQVMAFTDVEGHWAEQTISKMSDARVLSGYHGGVFKPDDYMTRAEFATVIDKLLGLKDESERYVPDITRDDWYADEIRRIIKAQIMQGDQDGYVRPNDKITREEAVVVLARAFKIQNLASIIPNYGDREEISPWAESAIISFAKYGYIDGYEGNLLKPRANITRAEAITIINRIIPNILTSNVYEGTMKGTALVFDNNVVLNSLTINGDLIISGGIVSTLKINNVEVKNNLILVTDIADLEESIKMSGKKYKLFEEQEFVGKFYENYEYGIKFAIPSTGTVSDDGAKIDFSKKDLIVIDIQKNDEYYLKRVDTIAKEKAKKYDNLFRISEEREISNANYVLLDDNDKSQMIVIKRDNIVYTIIFFNIESKNLVDNVLSTMELFENENVKDIEKIVYKNQKLSLKFTYLEKYVSVDDSYNTGIINAEDSFFNMFIQVTTISDMDKYTFNEVKSLLRQLAKKDGEVVDTTVLSVMNNDAVRFRIKNEEQLIDSLYVIVGNNLYKFIFMGDEISMNEIGTRLFDKIIKTIEF